MNCQSLVNLANKRSFTILWKMNTQHIFVQVMRPLWGCLCANNRKISQDNRRSIKFQICICFFALMLYYSQYLLLLNLAKHTYQLSNKAPPSFNQQRLTNRNYSHFQLLHGTWYILVSSITRNNPRLGKMWLKWAIFYTEHQYWSLPKYLFFPANFGKDSP